MQDQELFQLSVTFVLVLLMLYPSGMAGIRHLKMITKVSKTSVKVKQIVMSLFFFTVFGLALYVAIENGKNIREHESKSQ